MLTVKWNNTRNDLRIVLNLLEILILYQGNYMENVTRNVTLMKQYHTNTYIITMQCETNIQK